LRHAAYESLRRAGHRARVVCILQYEGRDRHAGCGDRQSAGGIRLISDLRDLYQETILDHNKRPRNFKKLENANRSADGYNPLCGDKVKVYLRVEDGRVKDLSFEGSGCAISKASASVMTESLKGKSVEEVETIFRRFRDLVMGKAGDADDLGKLVVFSGVCEFPTRVKCATLAWHALQAALQDSKGAVSTE
jgi:nitrogen fixation NifU-like protein